MATAHELEARLGSTRPVSTPAGPDQDLRLASEACQRAASAMIAATEAYRQQFRAQQMSAIRLTAFPTGASGAGRGNRMTGSLSVEPNPPGVDSFSSQSLRPQVGNYPYCHPTPADQSSVNIPARHEPSERISAPASAPCLTGLVPEAGLALPAMVPAGMPLPPTPRPRPMPAVVLFAGSSGKLHADLVDAVGQFHSPPRGLPLQPISRPSLTSSSMPSSSPDATSLSSRHLTHRHPLRGPTQHDTNRKARTLFSRRHEVLFVFVISMAQMAMLAAMAQALVPARLIGQSFSDTGPGEIAWYSAAYSLTAGTFVLPSGRLGDVFGHKVIFVSGFLWLAVSSFLAGFSPEIQNATGQGTVFFCFCRAMQGIGSALVVPNGQAMMGRAYPPGLRKNMAMSVFGAAAPLGFVLGAVMSSLFSQESQWPWAFWTLAGFSLGMATLAVVILPPMRLQEPQGLKPEREGLWSRLDVPGMALGVGGLVLSNFAVNQAPTVSWRTPYTYFTLIIGVMMLAAFTFTQRFSRYPLLPVVAMNSRTLFTLGCTAAGWGCFGVWIYYSIIIFDAYRGWSPLTISAAMAPAPIAGLVASLMTGWLLSRSVWAELIMVASMLSFLTGSVLLANAPVSQTYWLNTFFAFIVMPFGMDMSNPAAITLLSNSVSKEHQGVGASLVVTTINYSLSFCLGIAGTIQTLVANSNQSSLAGCRAAQYFGVGLGGFGLGLAGISLLARPATSQSLAGSEAKAVKLSEPDLEM